MSHWRFKVYKITRKGVVKYVGITRNRVETRWAEHRSVARNGRGFTLGAALRKHGDESFAIEHIVTCADVEAAKEVERTLISEYKTFGRNGYNRTPGGDGVGRDARVIGEGERAAISARNLAQWSDPDFREKTRANMRGSKSLSDDHKAKLSALKKGVKMSDETREKMRQSRIGKKHSPEVRARIAEKNRIRNQSEAQRAAIAASWERRRASNAPAQE